MAQWYLFQTVTAKTKNSEIENPSSKTFLMTYLKCHISNNLMVSYNVKMEQCRDVKLDSCNLWASLTTFSCFDNNKNFDYILLATDIIIYFNSLILQLFVYVLHYFLPHTLRIPFVGVTMMAIIFWDFLMFNQIFFSRQVEQNVIISNKHCIYELLHTLPDDLWLRVLGN